MDIQVLTPEENNTNIINGKTNKKGKSKNMKEKNGKKNLSLNIDPEVFVTTWQTSSNAQEVASRLNLTKAQVTSKAIAFRKHKCKS